MKRTILKTFVLSLLSIIVMSCADELSFPDYNKLPQAEFWQTQEHAEKALMFCYAQFTSDWAFYDPSVLGPEEMTGDNVSKGSSPGSQSDLLLYKDFSYSPATTRFNNLWKSRYGLINLCNQVIHYVPNMNFEDKAKRQILGEAKFIRAWAYFELTKLFGEVIVYDDLPSDGAYDIPRSSLQDVYKLILNDLKYGFDNMSKNPWSSEWKGRVTAWSARALEAKVLMYMASGANFTEDKKAIADKLWTDVLTVTTDVVNNSGYDLFYHPDPLKKDSSFYYLFRIPYENCIESIFEIQNGASRTNGGVGSAYAHNSWVRGQKGGGRNGFGYGVPSDDLVKVWEKRFKDENDLRFKFSVVWNGDKLPDGVIVNGDELVDGITGISRWNYKVYVPEYDRSGVLKDWYLNYIEQNMRLLRFADILLIHAEACFNTGNEDEALASINRVRERAGQTKLLEISLQDIWDERRFELAFEFDRYFDLIRTGQAKTVLASRGWKPEKHTFFPIPQEQLDLSNGPLQQSNPWK